MRGQFHESYCHRSLAQQWNITVKLLEDERSIELGERTLKRYDDLSERGLGLVVHVPSGCVAKINIP
jgi:hypothetical protein